VLDDELTDWACDTAAASSYELSNLGTQIKKAVRSSLLQREERAVTFSLFRDAVSQGRTGDEIASGIVRRKISEIYTRHYLDLANGDIATGLPGLTYYDLLAKTFPYYDIPVLITILDVVGLDLPLAASWTQNAASWRHWIANRAIGPEWHELYRCIRHIMGALISTAISDGLNPPANKSEIRNEITKSIRLASSKLSKARHFVNGLNVANALERSRSLIRTLSEGKHFAEAYDQVSRAEYGEMAVVLLVTAIELERDTALAAARSISGVEAELRFGQRRTYFDLGLIGGTKIFLVQSEMGSSGPGGSHATVADAIDDLKPQTVIMAGIAFGVDPEKQELGQILVSRQLHNYEMARVGSSDVGTRLTLSRGDRVTSSTKALSRFRAAQAKWGGSSVKFGLLLSGEKLVDNVDFREQIRSQEPEALGGEMEGAGLYTAAVDRNTDWIVVKAICDWADGRKRVQKARRQKHAAEQAIGLVFRTIQLGSFADIVKHK